MVEWTWKQWTWASTSKSTLMQGAEANKLRSASGARLPTDHQHPCRRTSSEPSGTSSAEIRRHKTWVSQNARHRRRRRGPAVPGVSNLPSKHKMLGGGGGKVSRPCARLLTTCKMLPPSLATSALIQELSLCHRLCPTRGHCRTPSGIWHLPDPCSHTRHCGIRDNRGQRLGAGQASASTSPKRTAPPTATTSARGGGGRILTTAPPYASLDEKRRIPICTATSAELR